MDLQDVDHELVSVAALIRDCIAADNYLRSHPIDNHLFKVNRYLFYTEETHVMSSRLTYKSTVKYVEFCLPYIF